MLVKIREDQENERKEGELLKVEREAFFETQINKINVMRKDADNERKELSVYILSITSLVIFKI
jgi:hypothetical protein